MINGQMTHYAGNQKNKGYGTGKIGYMGTTLQANKSVAVKKNKWNAMGCRTITMGNKTYIVDNVCEGPGCRHLDLYLGHKVSNREIAARGVKSVKFKVGKRSAACMKKCKWNCPKSKRRR